MQVEERVQFHQRIEVNLNEFISLKLNIRNT